MRSGPRALGSGDPEPVLGEELQEMGLSRLYYEVELPLARVAAGKWKTSVCRWTGGALEEVGREIEGPHRGA